MKPSKHSQELATAIAEDQRRQQIDAAKKRAVSQQADYDTFKKLVSVAHLKPLSAPSSKAAGGGLPAWSLDATGVLTAVTHTAPAATAGPQPHSSTSGTKPQPQQQRQQQQPELGVPRSSHEFLRCWRKDCPTPAAKYRLVKLCGPQLMAALFSVEISGELLGQLLLVLQEEWEQQQPELAMISDSGTSSSMPEGKQGPCHVVAGAAQATAARFKEATFVVQLLHGLTGAGRFDLNARLMSSNAKQAARLLCASLAAVLQQQQQQQEQQQQHGSAASLLAGLSILEQQECHAEPPGAASRLVAQLQQLHCKLHLGSS